MNRTESFKKINELNSRIRKLIERYDEMNADITRLYTYGNSVEYQVRTLESLKRACKSEINQLHNESVQIKQDIGLISK